MKSIPQKLIAIFALSFIFGAGYQVAKRDSHLPIELRTSTEKLASGNIAYAQNLERGFADLAKRAIPGVVNISTYAHLRMRRGGPMGGPPGQDELFRRFFEEFFGGRMQRPPGAEDDGGEGAPPIPAPGPRSGKAVPVALGTGFIIDANEGLILTNNHVVQGAEEVKIQYKEEDEQDLTPAEVIGRDPELDIALLKVKTKKLTAIPLGDSDAIDVGEYVLAIGNPLGYGHTVSHGIVSAKGRRNPEFRMGKYLQTDASINPGNSGGPLVNMKGEVIGINNAIDARAQGIGFAIPINLVKAILPQLKTKGSVSRGFLGVSVGDFTPEMAEQLKLDPKIRGVIISDVSPGQPAEKAGIRPYDVITAINGEPITNAQDMTSKVTAIPVGGKAKVELMRGGKKKTIDVVVAERPVAGGRPSPRKTPEKKGSPKTSAFEEFGFEAEVLTEESARAFGIPGKAAQGKGTVVITDLEFGKAAANSGLGRGDLILDVSGKEVHSIADLQNALNAVKGKSAMVRVKRYDGAGNDFVSVIVLSK